MIGLNFNATWDMRILDPEFASEALNIDFEETLNASGILHSANAAEGMMRRVAVRVYNFIESYAKNAERMRKILNTSEKAEAPLRLAMLCQLEYMINNGDLMNESGVNLANGTLVDRKSLKAAAMSGDTEDILRNHLLEDGCPIVYEGSSPWREEESDVL